MEADLGFNAYMSAQKEGKKYYYACVSKGKYPYIQVLEEIINRASNAGQFAVATLEIPIERIVGSVARGRVNAFAGNFMPLLGKDSEFAAKWISLIEEHETNGINDPIVVTEYMGLFYVQEGHKRVSVMKYEGLPTIRASVFRLLPPWSEDEQVRLAYELNDFFKLSGTYRILFSRAGSYMMLQRYMGFAPDHVWTDDERQTFHAAFWDFKQAYQKALPDYAQTLSADDALLVYLKLYPYAELASLDEAEIEKRLIALKPQLKFEGSDEPVEVSTQPEASEKNVFSRLLDGITRPTLRIAFVFASNPETSAWSHAHMRGSEFLKQALGDKIKLSYYTANDENAEEVMEQAVKDGAQLLIATAPTLLFPSRRIAAAHTNLKVLVCALSVPYADVRTYYCRMFEARFLTGAIAGSLWTGGSIGYVARYPILGEPASINAFALGVRMTAPYARVELAWSCVSDDPLSELIQRRARIISLYETTLRHTPRGDEALPMGTVMLQPSGEFEPVATACWYWGEMYIQLVQTVLNGGWDAYKPDSAGAVSYWWGMDSGVMDVSLSDSVPAGVRQLAEIIRGDLKDGNLKPFMSVIKDQSGTVRNDGTQLYSARDIMRMDWLIDNVSGRIPKESELLPMSLKTTKLLSLNPIEQKNS